MAATLRQRSVASQQPTKEQEHDVLASSDSEEDEKSPLKMLENEFPPFNVPTYTIKELLGAIPSHCFERSALRSSTYVVMDFALITAAYYAATMIDPAFNFKDGQVLNGWAGFAAKWALWATYWMVQSWFGTGVWILGAYSPCMHAIGGENARGLHLDISQDTSAVTRPSRRPRPSTTRWVFSSTRSFWSRTTRGASRTPSTTPRPAT
jgi:hypothetical protein